jgi:hypothetical protein
MRVLLDTHTLLWFALNDPQLSSAAMAVILDPANDKLVSPASQRTPREAGGLQGMAVSKTAFSHLEPTVLVKLLLLTDIFLDGFQLKTHRRYGIAARPEMLAGKVPYLPTKLTGYRQGTLSLQKPYH